jgi:hypothetical protein
VLGMSGPPSLAAAPASGGDEPTDEVTPSYLLGQEGTDVVMVSLKRKA